MLTGNDAIAAALQKEFDKGGRGIQEANGQSAMEFNAPAAEPAKDIVTPPVTPEPEKAPVTPEAVTPEVKIEEKPIEKPADAPDSSLKTKSLDELLAETSGGKFKSWSEVEEKLSAPKSFKSAYAEKLEAFVDAGGSEESYIATQSINFDKMSTTELLEYRIQAEDPDMSQEEISYEMKKRYGIDKWKDNAADYDDGIEPEEIKMAKLRFNREAEKSRAQFKEHQQKWAVAPAPKDNTAEVARAEAATKEWNNQAQKAVDNITKMTLKISDTESYDLTIDAAEKAEVQKTLNQLRVDAVSFWDSYKQKDGTYDMNGMANAMFKLKNFEKAVAIAADQASKKGAVSIVKDLKNTNLKPEEVNPGNSDAPLSREQQIAQGFKATLKT